MGIYGGKASGKSHFLRQLVGEDGFWFGEVYICGYDLKRNTSKALACLRYCPQQAGCFDSFTIYQFLKLILLESGATQQQMEFAIKNISKILNIENFVNKRFEELSHNVKRKVNIAAALFIGDSNKIIVLDEPTQGLPLKDRQLIWQILKYARSYSSTIILASTDSQELEELTEYIFIVNKGEILAKGSTHYLRQKFKPGCLIEIKLNTMSAVQNR